MTAEEDWRKSQLYIRIKNKTGTINSDERDWQTHAQLQASLGKDGADSMVAFLEANNPEKCRDHPDARGIKDC